MPKIVAAIDEVVELSEPYINGFLAFREVPHYLAVLQRLEREHGVSCRPDVLMVDGNGIFHKRGFGAASHLGVLAGIPRY